MQIRIRNTLLIGMMHHADSDPDPTFRFDADPEPDSDPKFTHAGISETFSLLLLS
jgi:hypothetical protein